MSCPTPVSICDVIIGDSLPIKFAHTRNADDEKSWASSTVTLNVSTETASGREHLATYTVGDGITISSATASAISGEINIPLGDLDGLAPGARLTADLRIQPSANHSYTRQFTFKMRRANPAS